MGGTMETITTIKWPGLEADLFKSENFCAAGFNRPVRTLSSAVLSGGYSEVSWVLNHAVEANPEVFGIGPKRELPTPEESLAGAALRLGMEGSVAGLMTSASMKSYRWAAREEEWGGVFCFLTTGLTNSRAAGDPGEFAPEISLEELPTGTINIVIGTSARLTPAALAEALMITAEAKVGVMTKYNILSPVTGRPSTGTGTDSVLVASGDGPDAAFCGKHTRLGQFIGETVTEALSSSVEVLLTLPEFDHKLYRGIGV